MKRLIITLMVCGLLGAQSFANPYLGIASASVIPSSTYFLEENFEGSGYQTGWTEVGSGFDEDYTVSPLEGSQSLRGSLSGFVYTYDTFSGRDSISGKFMFVLASTSGNPRITLSRVGVADDMIIYFRNASGKLHAQHGTIAASLGTTTINTGTTYWVWWTWTKGSGANGVLNVYLNTTDSKPGAAELSTTTGNGISQPTAVSFQGENGADFKVDALKLSDSAFN